MEQMGETLVQMALDLLEENGVPREKVSSVGMGFDKSFDILQPVVQLVEALLPAAASGPPRTQRGST